MCGKETGFSPSVLYLKRTNQQDLKVLVQQKNEPESAFTGEKSPALCRLTITLQSKGARHWTKRHQYSTDFALIKVFVLNIFFG
jgi:hypothetical protein